MKNSFFLVIPQQETRPERAREFEQKSLEQWLNELPTANPGLATRLLVDHVQDMNGLKLPVQQRIDALEMMRPKFLIIEEYLRSRLISTAFPKEENDYKILQVLTGLERDFTIGYWAVLKELTRRQVSWFQGKNIALTLQRCIKGLSGVVISHVIMGLPVPDWVWIDLHSLYKLSVKIKKHDTKVPDSTNLAGKASSPDECYRQILLLYLSRPTGLMQKEVQLVYGFIESLFSFFSLSAHPVEEQPMQFVVLTDEDKPPKTQFDLHATYDSATLYVDLSRLYKALEKKERFITQVQNRFASMHILKNHEEKPTSELLEYLVERWSGIELHREALFSDRLDRLFGIGMAPAYALVNNDSSFSKNGESEQEFMANTDSDRLLVCPFDKPGQITVGNLITIRKSDQAPQKRGLGVVNELIVTKQSNKVIFGINLISNHYDAVLYVMANSRGSTPSKGLFFNADDQYEETSYLIVDNVMLKDGDLIAMQLNQDNIYLILKERKNIGLGYWQFECHRVAAKIDGQESQQKKGYDFI